MNDSVKGVGAVSIGGIAVGGGIHSGIDADRFVRARDFVLRNARLVDRYLFACLFEGASNEPVREALRAYRNPDGGFGNALEPDKRCPDSQPVDAEEALKILDVVDGFDDPMVEGVCDWLEQTADATGGVPFVLPSANDYPHAPWWEAPPEPPPSINPTGSIVAILTKRNVAHPWVERGTEFCWRSLEDEQATGFNDLRCAIAFLEQAADRERAAASLDRIRAYLFSSDEIEYDLSAPGYVHTPLDWAPAPVGFGHGLFTRDQLIEGLAALANAQRDDGGWPIKWPAISPGVELEWRGRVTIDALLTLRSYAMAGYGAA
ncbi:MAG: hypothetical protein OXH37_01060 [Gammaproteobacteria bacterium]|nr:hypothetical protein [Gammaproteobacteria bacterium]